MAKYVDYEGIKEFYNNIINAPVVEDPDYLIGTYDDKLVRMEVDGGGKVITDAKAGDICFYDNRKGKKVLVAFDDWNEDPSQYPADRYIPIGVVVIPTSHDVYGTGECAIMSLVLMSHDTPDTGSAEEKTLVFWGGYNDDSGLPNYTKVIVCGTIDNPTDSPSEYSTINGFVRLPSDSFTSSNTPCPTDPDAYYYDSNVTRGYYAIPSPYLLDGSRNPSYYEGDTSNVLSDFNGKDNTSILLDHATSQENWKTATTITNSLGPGSYPAACCCWRYHTDGTSLGDWYLPSMGELGYMIVRIGKISTTLLNIMNFYEVETISSFGYYCYPSNLYSNQSVIYLHPGAGALSNEYKLYSRYIVAFLRV